MTASLNHQTTQDSRSNESKSGNPTMFWIDYNFGILDKSGLEFRDMTHNDWGIAENE